MPSTTLKRTAATLGVVAGLLAAAGPATAGVPASNSSWTNDALTVKAPKPPASSEEPVESISFNLKAAQGTQIGSEGRKP
jgi:hypothetical protein